ncbi:TPA: Ankyrin repeat and SOCS box protein 2 [Trebouxia sp. C0004]
MQRSCRYTSSSGVSTSGRDWQPDVAVLGHLANKRCTRHHIKHRSCRIYTAALGCWRTTQQQASCLKDHFGIQRSRQHITGQYSSANGVSSNGKGPVIVIDNYDSFTYNLCQYLGDLGCEHLVYKNDEKTIEELRALNPRGILLSPGPGRPEDSGIALQTVRELGTEFPIFGVCMGHQCIGQVFGGDVVRAPSGVMHGKTSPVHHKNSGLLKGLSNPFLAARYHSLVIAKDSVPDVLEVTAWTDDGTVMAVQHKQYPHIQGVQFHPESIITDNGRQVVKNFIDSLP